MGPFLGMGSLAPSTKERVKKLPFFLTYNSFVGFPISETQSIDAGIQLSAIFPYQIGGVIPLVGGGREGAISQM